MNQITQSLQQTRGDTVTHTIQTTWLGALYDPSEAGLVQDAIFSLKSLATDSDEDAIFQKALGFGIELASNSLLIAFLPSDTREIEDVSKRFVWDVRVLETAGDRKTVATGTLLLFANITRDLDLTLAVTTTNAPDINHVTETMLNEAIAAATILAQTAAVYVAKVGSDTNNGTTVGTPLLTIGAAITTAEALITAGASGVNIDVMDGGSYTGTLEIPATVHIEAPAATFVGTVAIDANASFAVDKHFAAANNEKMVEHSGGSLGAAIYKANIQDGRGAGGTLTGVANVRNVGGGGKNLFAHVGVLYVGASGTGIGDVSSGVAGHIHIYIPDLYLAGNNAVGILGSAQGAGSSNIVGFIDHILETGTPTGTVGISMTAAGAEVKLTASEIVADTAYNISAGSLYLACPKITGAVVGTPTNKLIGTIEINEIVDAILVGHGLIPAPE